MTTVVERPALPHIQVLGFAVHDLGMDGALDAIDTFIAEGSPHIVVTADSSMLVMAQHDEELAAILRKAALVTVDSAGVLWAARRNGASLRTRVSGVELVEQLCKHSQQRGIRLYFLGSAPGIAQGAAAEMERRYPGAVMVGAYHGYYPAEEEQLVCDEVRRARPDVLCVAMGIPRQEKWINQHQNEIGVPVAIGVGGTFDVLSGSVRRAPRWIQSARLEWLWRTLANPKKAHKAALLPRFVVMNLLRRRNGC
ncbi:MAG: WecB/TagA/CpsF family glycosyltransferase [Armatimonadetes bacterium]|nr:WecB/TagA/CpsF family glycosyltransferase [Armatimonadota bacterium]MDE2206120.1 WecB/TagA/CpsF family glycosyltransferase [Armatimonadota bacterium]